MKQKRYHKGPHLAYRVEDILLRKGCLSHRLNDEDEKDLAR